MAPVHGNLLTVTKLSRSRCASILLRNDKACYIRTAVNTTIGPASGLLVLTGNTCNGHVTRVTRCCRVSRMLISLRRARLIANRITHGTLRTGPSVARLSVMRDRAAANLLGPVRRITRILGNHGVAFVISTVDDFNNIPVSVGGLSVSFLIDDTGGYVRNIPNFNFVVTGGSGLVTAGKGTHSLSLSVCTR